jgi:ferredoxin
LPDIEILASAARASVRVSASGPLVDICDEARSPVELSCRDGTCGTCCVEVLAGEHLLEPPLDREIDGLRRLAQPVAPRQRLACQAIVAIVRPVPGLVRLRWVGRPPPNAPPT